MEVSFSNYFHSDPHLWGCFPQDRLCIVACMSLLQFTPSPSVDGPKISDSTPPVQDSKLRLSPLAHVTAIEHLGKLKGATQPELMRADDGHVYVVKLTTNPMGSRVVVNEYLASRLARGLGLAIPDAAIVRVANRDGDQTGVHFGSRVHKQRGHAFRGEWLPAAAWKFVANPADLIGAYVFDAWTGNADSRQVIFARESGLVPLRLYLIDNSHCFCCRKWRLFGIATLGSAQLPFGYCEVTGWHNLDPWLSQIENLESSQIRRAAEGVPDEWLPGDERIAFEKLLDELDNRRFETRALIARALERRLHPFSNWRIHSGLYVLPPRRAFGKTA